MQGNLKARYIKLIFIDVGRKTIGITQTQN